MGLRYRGALPHRPSLVGLIAPSLVFLWLAYLFASNGNASFVPAWLWMAIVLPIARMSKPFVPLFPPLRFVNSLFGLGCAALFLLAALWHA